MISLELMVFSSIFLVDKINTNLKVLIEKKKKTSFLEVFVEQ